MPFLYSCLSFDGGLISGWQNLVFPPSDLDETIRLEFTYQKYISEKSNEYEFSVFLTNQNYPNEVLVYYATAELIRGNNTIKRTFFFYPNTLSEGENIITLSAKYNRLVDNVTFITHLKTYETFNPAFLDDGVYSSPVNDIHIINGQVYAKGDVFQFQNFTPYVEDEFYSYFKLNFFSFMSQNNFTYQEAYLLIKDENLYYRRFPKSLKSNYREIPLKIMQDELESYFFLFKNKLFVDPDTFLMSPNKIDGYLETNYFYFPKERFANEQEIAMMIVVTNCGQNEVTINYEFTYYSHLNFIGDCQNSKYCIQTSTNNNEASSEYEEVIVC